MEEKIAVFHNSGVQQPKNFPAMSHESNCFPPSRPAPQQQARQARARLEIPEGDVPRAQDYWRINLREDWEITFWTREFGCTEEALREAVRSVGDCAGDVRGRLLAEHQQRSN
jgi:hypothetical protein